MSKTRSRSADPYKTPALLTRAVTNVEVRELKSSVHKLDTKLLTAASDLKALRQALDVSQAYVQQLESKLEKQLELNRKLNQDNSIILARLEHIKAKGNQSARELEVQLETFKKRSEAYEATLHDQRQALAKAIEETARLSASKEKSKRKLKEVITALHASEDLAESDRSLTPIIQECTDVAKTKQEIGWLSSQNKKLQELLENPDAKQVAGHSKGLTYLPSGVHCSKKQCGANQAHFDADDWVPVQLTKEYLKLSESAKCLFKKANAAWRERQKKRIERVQTSFRKKVNRAKHSNSSPPKKLSLYRQLTQIYDEYIGKIIKEVRTEVPENHTLSTSLTSYLTEYTDKIIDTLT